MRIVLGFVLVSLVVGFVAWLVAGRGPVASTASEGFLDDRFGDDEPEPEPAPALIKGKTSSMIFHAPDSPSYSRTVADVWFETEQDAIAAGYRPPKRRGSATP